ncbi:MAG: hypothetical protein OEV95_11270 [Gemmatimonadota bacterium]|nr:hypothetical protein [Gemmatimonadota bacterium]MDH5282438.1 hypothetical protein [Gemmatimonadota bacterium]
MRLPAFALAALVLAQPAAAQVGHPPQESPFRDITKKWSLTALYGRIGGDGGKIGVGPHDGPTYGGRFELVLGAPVAAAITVSHGDFVRDILIVQDTLAPPTRGTVDQDVLMIEAALQLNVTGRKTWHRLAPFLALSAGWAGGSTSPDALLPDESDYQFDSEFYWSVSGGTRLFLSRQLFLRGDARYVSWKLKYPNTELDLIPDDKFEEWDGNFEWRVGLGFAF